MAINRPKPMPVKTVLEWFRRTPYTAGHDEVAPVSTLLALEPRLMFDGAAAVTAEAGPAAERSISAAERGAGSANGYRASVEKTVGSSGEALKHVVVGKDAAPGTVTLSLTARDGGATEPVYDGVTRVTAGDAVTFSLDYRAPAGDYHGLRLSASLPTEVFDVADPRSDGSGRPLSWAGGAGGSTPPLGTWNVRIVGGDGTPLATPTVEIDRASNALVFVFGDRFDAGSADARIEVSFTVGAGSRPVVDGTVVNAIGRARTLDAGGAPVVSQELEPMRIKVPDLDLVKGVVQDDVVRAGSAADPSYSPQDPRDLLLPAGNTAAQPLRATLDAAGIRALDTDIAGVDAHDTLRFAIVLTNGGGGGRGAFDVTLDDNLPWGVDRASVSNLRITYGDGRVLYDGTAATLSRLTDGNGTALRTADDAIAALIDGSGLRLVDDVGADGIAGTGDDRGALPGLRDTMAVSTPRGGNVLVVTYDARVAPWMEPGKTMASSATLTHYASRDGGPDFTSTDPADDASVRTTLLAMTQRLVATSEPDRVTVGNDAVIGERLTYEITIAVPEGATLGAILADRLAPGLSLVSVDAITASPGIVFAGGTPSTGAVRVTSVDGGDANRFELTLGDLYNIDTDNSRRETITVRYTAVADNVALNRQGTTLGSEAVLDAACQTLGASADVVRIVEPSLSIRLDGGEQRPAVGGTATFTVTISAAAGRPPAQEVSLDVANLVPSGLAYVPGSLAQVSGPAASSIGFGGSGIVADWSTLAPGTQVVLRFDARVVDGAPSQPLEQAATVRWSSLPGGTNTDLSPFATTGDFERTGRMTDPGGALNTYSATSRAPVSAFDTLTPRLTLVASSEAGSVGTSVVPGEVLRYRMVVQLPEGALGDVELRPLLPDGLRFVADGTATVAFVADGAGLTSSTLTGSSFLLFGGGSDIASIAGLRPLQPLPVASIRDASGSTVAPGTVLPAGQGPRLVLGDLTIADRDANREFVVIEFDAIVDNAAGNVAGTSNPLTFDVTSGGLTVARSNTVVVEVAEPRIVDLDKQVVAVSGNQVTFEATFSNSGTQTAYDVRLVDVFAGVPGATFSGATSRPVGSSDASTADTLDVRLPQLAPGESATVRYVLTLADPATAVAPRDAVVTYTSLSAPGTFLPVETAAGLRLTPTTGERTGDTADYGGSANAYRDADPAGLAAVRGTLWNDTDSPDGAIGIDEARLAGVTVTLTAAGRDGLLGTTDDLVLSTLTDAQGRYAFGGLPAGELRIVAPTPIANANGTLGEVRARVDGQGSPTDARMDLRVDEGTMATDLDIGYVERNDAPTVVVPERIALPIDGTVPVPGLRIGDVDAGPTGVLTVTVAVDEGTLQVATGTPGVTIAGNGTGTLTLQGTVDALNASLATLGYDAAPGFAGNDRLVVTVNDGGNTGDADGDGVPNEPIDDALTATADVPIRVGPSKFPPVALPDANRTSAADTQPALGNVLTGGSPGDRADSDPDNDPIEVQGVRAGSDTTLPALGSTDVPVAGRHGTIVVGPDGRYAYRVDVNNADVQALKPGQTLTDVFVYTVRDPAGLTSTTTITITIDGVNDAPSASSVSQAIDRPVPGAPPPRIPVAPPTVMDRDDASTDLVVRIDAIDRPGGGTFLRPDGTPVLPGQTLTVDQLQQLTFVPSDSFSGTPGPDGTTATSSLVFTVSDPSGASSTGRIDLALRPGTPATTPTDTTASSSISFGGIPPGPVAIAGVGEEVGYVPPQPAEFPPIGNGPGLQFSVPQGPSGGTPPAISTTVAELRGDTIDGREALDAASRTTDLDADGLLPSNRVAGFFGEEAIGPLRDGKSLGGPRPTATTSALATGPGPIDPASATALAAAPAPVDGAAGGRQPTDVAGVSVPGIAAKPVRPQVAADDDCKPVVVAKPRPKPVKRILADGVVPKPSTSFSEQIDVQKKKFKLPPKVAPKPPLERQC
ncbi:MAG: hypothetical protein RJA99_3543 [Pseudomonadota bacterium]